MEGGPRQPFTPCMPSESPDQVGEAVLGHPAQVILIETRKITYLAPVLGEINHKLVLYQQQKHPNHLYPILEYIFILSNISGIHTTLKTK